MGLFYAALRNRGLRSFKYISRASTIASRTKDRLCEQRPEIDESLENPSKTLIGLDDFVAQ